MDVHSIYERVTFTTAIDQVTFIGYLKDAVSELRTFYGDMYVLSRPDNPEGIETLDDGISVYDEYFSAIIDDILFYATGDDDRKTDFVSKSKYAYHTVWRRKNTGRRIRKDVW